MSKKPKPPATIDLTSIIHALDHASELIRLEAEKLTLARARIADAKRGIVGYALAVAPVVEEEVEVGSDPHTRG